MEEYAGLSSAEKNCLNECLKMEAECRSIWVRAIDFSPKLAAYCTHWGEFTPKDWAKLLANNAQFADIAPLHKLGDAEWYIILGHQPLLITKCPIINEMQENFWEALLKEFPWFKEYAALRKKSD